MTGGGAVDNTGGTIRQSYPNAGLNPGESANRWTAAAVTGTDSVTVRILCASPSEAIREPLIAVIEQLTDRKLTEPAARAPDHPDRSHPPLVGNCGHPQRKRCLCQ